MIHNADELIQSAKSGEADEQYAKARSLLSGEKNESNIAAAIELLTLSAKANHAEAQYCLGEHYYDQKNYYEAVRWFVLAAGQSHEGALKMLADCYLFGLGTAKDENKAQIYRRKAAELNEKKDKLVNGRDFTETKLLREYGEKRDGESIVNLAEFFHAKGSYAQCAKWAKEGAASGVTECVRILAGLCEKGQGVPVDYARSKSLFLLAFKDKSAAAAEEIAQRYQSGGPVFGKANVKKAAKWYAEAYKLGSAAALDKLKAISPKQAEKIQRNSTKK